MKKRTAAGGSCLRLFFTAPLALRDRASTPSTTWRSVRPMSAGTAPSPAMCSIGTSKNSKLARQNNLDHGPHPRKALRDAHNARKPDLDAVDLARFLHRTRHAARAQAAIQCRGREAVAADLQKHGDGFFCAPRYPAPPRRAGTALPFFPVPPPAPSGRCSPAGRSAPTSPARRAPFRVPEAHRVKSSLPEVVDAERPQKRDQLFRAAHSSPPPGSSAFQAAAKPFAFSAISAAGSTI